MSMVTQIQSLATRIATEINTLRGEVLTKTNNAAYTPTSDYNPATKKYVDDNSGGGSSYTEVSINLTSAGWSSNSQNITINGLTTSSDVMVFPPSNRTAFLAYGNAQINASSISANTLTFSCSEAPGSDINNVIVLWK